MHAWPIQEMPMKWVSFVLLSYFKKQNMGIYTMHAMDWIPHKSSDPLMMMMIGWITPHHHL